MVFFLLHSKQWAYWFNDGIGYNIHRQNEVHLLTTTKVSNSTLLYPSTSDWRSRWQLNNSIIMTIVSSSNCYRHHFMGLRDDTPHIFMNARIIRYWFRRIWSYLLCLFLITLSFLILQCTYLTAIEYFQPL